MCNVIQHNMKKGDKITFTAAKFQSLSLKLENDLKDHLFNFKVFNRSVKRRVALSITCKRMGC